MASPPKTIGTAASPENRASSNRSNSGAPANEHGADPQWRRLRGYAFDPGLSQQFETAAINQTVFRIPWEPLEPGPVGEYVEVLDYDPASDAYYDPVNLDRRDIVAADGCSPDESNPQFHQQFVYAVAMLTIRNFERALGRRVLWSRQDEKRPRGKWDVFVRRLRIYPHAFRGANAFYSPAKKALLFGYFPASSAARGSQLPGGLLFTCLSHDIIAHETTHALLDAILPKYLNPTNPDALAFHEAFADIVALFQHFSFPEVLKHQISKTRGDLASQSLLGELAQQFGQATGLYGGLREAIGQTNEKTGRWEPLEPNPLDYERVQEPHARGALLVAAVFDAFLAIYRERVADLLRIATGGSGILPAGALPIDLVNRLTQQATKAAQHVLSMCIRALDYCPPVDLTFGDYLRAIITADRDLVPDDDHHYRVAIIEAFRRRGIYPRNLRTLSEESLSWPRGKELDEQARSAIEFLANQLRDLPPSIQYRSSRREVFERLLNYQVRIHNIVIGKIDDQILGNLEKVTGLVFRRAPQVQGITLTGGMPSFRVESLRPVRRRGPNGEEINHVVIGITQRRFITKKGEEPEFPGGCTLILDLDTLDLRYAISKPIDDAQRESQFRQWLFDDPVGAQLGALSEPIAHLHSYA
ncbi:MAG: hypothetical protein QOG67_171 [Verrucomicrobiota bacterium]|jgi:hypothetical protein